MNTLIRYAKLWGALFRTSLIAEMEYRANVVGKICADIVWYAAQLSLFEVLFKHSSQIAGWSLPEIRVFMGMLFFVDSLYMILFHENLDTFSQKVIRGELDLILAKPVNSQFMMSLNRVSVPYFVNTTFILLYLGWACAQVPDQLSILTTVLAFIVALSGAVLMYTMRFFFASLAVVFTKADAFMQLWYQVYRLATRPDSLYPSWLRIILLTVVPVAFVVSVPTRILLQRGNLWLAAVAVGFAALGLTLSSLWWKMLLKQYSSASS